MPWGLRLRAASRAIDGWWSGEATAGACRGRLIPRSRELCSWCATPAARSGRGQARAKARRLSTGTTYEGENGRQDDSAAAEGSVDERARSTKPRDRSRRDRRSHGRTARVADCARIRHVSAPVVAPARYRTAELHAAPGAKGLRGAEWRAHRVGRGATKVGANTSRSPALRAKCIGLWRAD